MQVVKKITIGSVPFFSCYDDFRPSDTDYLCLVSNAKCKDGALRTKIKNDDILLYDEGFTKEDFIREAMESGVPFKIGKFLVPEFIEVFGITFDDLAILQTMAEQIDDKHQYEKIIYDAYMENESFMLTDEQRLRAYESYKAARIKMGPLKPMNIIKKIRVGSYPFFGMLDGFIPGDEDCLLIVDNMPDGIGNSVHVKNIHAILVDGQKNKEELLRDAMKSKMAYVICQYMVPEFVEYYNITLEDLERLRRVKDKVMPRHEYLKIIYDAYMENGAFVLTDEQRLRAYESYKAARKMRYENPLIPLTDDALRRYEEQQKQK